jgi:hypothetical protein
LAIFPAPEKISLAGSAVSGHSDGIFRRFAVTTRRMYPPVKTEPVQPAGPAREIPLSSGKAHIALAPNESDFTNAAVWRIHLPANLDMSQDPLLRIRYVGDVARLTLNGRLIDDNFYNGREFDLGLKRFMPEIVGGDLRLEILPLRKDAPIYLADEAKPDFGKSGSIGRVDSVEIIGRCGADFGPGPDRDRSPGRSGGDR